MNKYTKEEMEALIAKYAGDNLVLPDRFEHRYDQVSSRILYSLLREAKPQNCLEFGTSYGGSALVTLKALIRNELPYRYVGFEIDDGLNRETLRNITHWLAEGVAHQIHFELWGDIKKNLHKVPDKLDFAFVDPDWDEDIAIWTFENIIPRVKKGALIHIHDWSVTEDLKYEGGSFPGIKYLIKLFEEDKMPLKKIFAVWDHEEYRKMSIASSFWEKI